MDEELLFDVEGLKEQFRQLGIDIDRLLNDKKLSTLADEALASMASRQDEDVNEWVNRLGEQMASAGEYYQIKGNE